MISNGWCRCVTDAGVELSHAEFGAFFYNVIQGRRRSLYALHAVRRAARGLREISDAAQHGDLRADLPRPAAGALRRYSGRSALRQERALSWHAGRPSSRAQLSGSLGRLAVGRSSGRTVLRPCTARRFYRARRADREALGGAGRRRDRQCAPSPGQAARNRGAQAGRRRTATAESELWSSAPKSAPSNWPRA